MSLTKDILIETTEASIMVTMVMKRLMMTTTLVTTTTFTTMTTKTIPLTQSRMSNCILATTKLKASLEEIVRSLDSWKSETRLRKNKDKRMPILTTNCSIGTLQQSDCRRLMEIIIKVLVGTKRRLEDKRDS